MPYAIVFKRGDKVLGSTPWGGSFASAKDHAIEHFPIRQQQGADYVQVLDDNDQVLFSHPRALKKAP